MIDAFVVFGIVCFVIGVTAIYLTRKTLGTIPRVLAWAGTIIILLVTIMRAEQNREKVEEIWQPGSIDWSNGPKPVRIYWNELSFPDYNEAFSSAVKIWNDRAAAVKKGCRLLARVPSRGDAQIVLRPYDGADCGAEELKSTAVDEREDAPAYARYCNGHVDIQLMKLASTGQAMRIVLHEVGHGLGLGHDDVGAMAKKALEPVTGDYPEYLLPSQKDVDALVARLCP